MLESKSGFLFATNREDDEFMRKNCAFNVAVLHASFEDYRGAHPEQFTPDGLPRPQLPDDYTQAPSVETNRTNFRLQQTKSAPR